MAPAPQNPFYASPSTSSTSRGPPPAPPPRPTGEPVSYGSLAALTSGRAQPSPGPGGRASPAPPSYASSNAAASAGRNVGSGGFTQSQSQSQAQPEGAAGGRRLPPFERRVVPPEPPRRNVDSSSTQASPSTPTSANQSYWSQASTKASAYIPNSVSATAASVGDRAKDGFDSVVNQQRKEQVMSGLGKAAGGAAKLVGKGALQLGKFAAGSK